MTRDDEAAEQRMRVRRQFNRQADEYARNEVVLDRRLVSFLVGLADPQPSERVLDVACGPAYLTLAFAERAAFALGVDVTDAFLSRARASAAELGMNRVGFVQADVERLPLADGSFDVASCKFALHHFARPELVLAEMKRVTRPGGRLVLVDMLTSEDPSKAELHDRIERLCDPSHARALAESELDAMIADAGLRVAAKHAGRSTERLGAWLAHGGPPPEAAREIERLLRSSIADDRAGLQVREENGELVFDHRGGTYLLVRP